jgi:uncharacterized damage-inducible protein DinB
MGRSGAFPDDVGRGGRVTALAVVLHVANRGSYHRGQVSAMLRTAGFAPAPTDLMLYYRQLG